MTAPGDVHSYIMKRTQIYLSDEQHRVLASVAKRRGTTASAVIREAIDGYLVAQLGPGERLERLRALGARFAARSNDDAADSAALVDDLREQDATRLDSLA